MAQISDILMGKKLSRNLNNIIDIQIKRPSRTFLPGEKVEGELVIVSKSALKVGPLNCISSLCLLSITKNID